MRGKELHAAPSAWIQGITPAYAGKRICFASWKAKEKDHPRVCGEKRQHLRQCNACSGSPPRMRGKVKPGTVLCTSFRITPAYAGKSVMDFIQLFQVWDHPRVCGEKPQDYTGHKLAEGSPPRMRGKASGQQTNNDTPRITPAYAGKSYSPFVPAWISGDHPRVCGEKNLFRSGL